MSPTLRFALVMLLAWLGLTACAGRGAKVRPTQTASDAVPHLIKGRITFEASYGLGRNGDKPLDPASLVPDGHTGLPALRVCAVRQVGWNDLVTERSLVDDEIVGCAITDPTGRFELRASTGSCPKRGDCTRTIYLATDLCAWANGRAEACVTTNASFGPALEIADWRARREYRKLLWSRPTAITLRGAQPSLWSWNLSCPTEHGVGESDVSCERPQRWGKNHRAGSNVGKNVEAVHLYHAMAKTVEAVGTLLPTPNNSDADDGRLCGRDGSRLKRRQCNEPVRVVLRELRNPLWRAERACERMWKVRKVGGLDFYLSLRTVCMGTIRDPFVVSHELGHALQARWLDISAGLTEKAPVKWREAENEKAAVAEGFANFVAAMTWYPRNARDPKFIHGRLEVPRPARCTVAPAGEGPITGFFWDLWDDARPDEPDDQVREDFATIVKIWSRFPGGDRGSGEHGAVECGPDGRNLLDYAHHWERKGKLPRLTPLLEGHCLHLQERRYMCPRP